MNDRTRIVYPNISAMLGGAIYAETNGISAWVKLSDRTIRMPYNQAKLYFSDGLALAEEARKFAYRNL